MKPHLSSIVTGAIKTIESSHADYELITAAARSIEADVAINTRFLTLKGVSTNDEFVSRMDEYEAVNTSLQAAFEVFTSDPSVGRIGLLSAFTEVQRFAIRFSGGSGLLNQ